MLIPIALMMMAAAEPEVVITEQSDVDFWSVVALAEVDGAEREMYGAGFSRVFYYDEESCGIPPIGIFVGGEYVDGDGQSIIRATGTFSFFGFRMGPYFSFWFRPIVGLERRFSDDPNSDGLGALVSLGGELMIRPKPEWHVVLMFDRIFSTKGTDNRTGLGIRWGRIDRNRYTPQPPTEGAEPESQ